MATEFITDESTTFVGGQDASKKPDLIPKECYASGVNVSTEEGNLKPRWGMQRHALAFPTGGVEKANTSIKTHQDIFRTGKFQALVPYSVGSTYYLVAVVSGQIYLINIKTLGVEHIPLEGEQINSAASRINTSPAGKFLVLFDYPNFPVIIDGITARRADPDKDEIPVSTIGSYNESRLFVGNAGNEFTAGDPVGSSAAPDAPITFQEVLQIASPYFGQVFQLSTNYNNDPITALTFLQVADTGTGIGPFLAATKQAIYSYQTQLPRDQWAPEDLSAVFGSLFVYNAGIVGPKAVDHLNSDVFFVSADGQVRSLAMSRQEQGKWSKTPVSREVKNWLKASDQDLLQYSFVTYFKNKIFISANPFRTTALGMNNERLPDYAFAGMVVMELDNISTLGKESAPSWAGLWTGCRPMDMVVCNDRCFVMSKDGNVNELYELRPDLTYDTDGKNIRYIKSIVRTREYNFQESEFNNKQLQSIELDLKDVRGDFSVGAKYRPAHNANFQDWRTFEHKAPWRNCRKPFDFRGLAPHSFNNINLGSPPGLSLSCNPVAKVQNQTFKRVQIELTLEGIYWEIDGLRLRAVIEKQNDNINSCGEYPAARIPRECDNSWQYGEFETCHQRQT